MRESRSSRLSRALRLFATNLHDNAGRGGASDHARIPSAGQPCPYIRRRASSIEPEDIGVRIRSTSVKIGDDLRRNNAKRDAIAAVAERKIGMGKFRSLADVGQAVFGFAECARPCIRDFQVKSGEHLTEATLKFSGLSGDQLIALMSGGIGHIFATDDRSVIRRGAKVKIGPRRFPYQRAIRPSIEAVERLTNQCKRALKDADVLFQVLLRLVAGRKHDSVTSDSRTWIHMQDDAVV